MNKPPLLYEGRAFENWTYLDVCNTLKAFYPQELNQEGKPKAATIDEALKKITFKLDPRRPSVITNIIDDALKLFDSYAETDERGALLTFANFPKGRSKPIIDSFKTKMKRIV